MSKGSKRRPSQVPREEVERRWEETFGKGAAEAWERKYGPSYSDGDDVLATARARIAAQILSGVRVRVPVEIDERNGWVGKP